MSDKPKWWPKNPYYVGTYTKIYWEEASETIWKAMKKHMGGDKIMMAANLQSVDDALDDKQPLVEVCSVCRGLCGKYDPETKIFTPCLNCGGNGLPEAEIKRLGFKERIKK